MCYQLAKTYKNKKNGKKRNHNANADFCNILINNLKSTTRSGL